MTKKTRLIGLGLFGLALLLRLPYLGSFMTIDEVKWIEGAGQFLLALQNGQLAQTYWHFFPGIPITWGEVVLLWVQYLYSGQADLAAFVADRMTHLAEIVGLMRLSTVVITSLTVVGIYWLAQPLLGQGPALLGAGLLAADPFFVAHSRIVNGDAAAAGLMLLAFLAFVRLWQRPGWRFAALAGVFAGLALLTKLPAPIIAPWLIFLAAAGYFLRPERRFWLRMLIISGAATAITFILLWPAMWVAPLNTLLLMARDSFNVGEIGAGHETFFLGRISDDPGWLFYPYAIAFRLTPLTILGLISVLLWLWRGRNEEEPVKVTLVVTLFIYILTLYLFANISPKKLDRYLMAVIPALTLLAGVGLHWAIEKLLAFWPGRTRFQMQGAAWLMPGLVAIQALFTVTSYPYVLTYYNPLLGGFERASRQVPVGWGEGLEQAAAWLNAQPNAKELRVSAWYGDMVQPYLDSQMVSFSSSGKGQLSADYVIFYLNQVQRQNPNPALLDYFARRGAAYVVEQDSRPLAWIYDAPAMQVEVSKNNEIEGRAEMMGYSWQPVPDAGQAAGLTLFFHTLGPLPGNETFDVALAGEDGTLWGTWQPSLPIDWQPGAIIEWRGTLTLPPDIPAGQYYLAARLIDTNINSEVARFPLQEALIRLND